ncbi:unnamed protein product [Trichobilharzia regenti]|nr:unnamed protein product [Trichobilharzia regenti]
MTSGTSGNVQSANSYNNNNNRSNEEKRQQLLSIRQQLALEFYEHHNSGNWRRIFPTDDPALQKKYASMIISNFGQFLHRNRGDLLDEIKTTYLNPVTVIYFRFFFFVFYWFMSTDKERASIPSFSGLLKACRK